MSLEAGTRVTPSVELVRPLGEGGMGSVWIAHHSGLDAEVAVKFVTAEGEGNASRFKREAALSAKIKSPHVVKTFDYGVTDEGQPYIVMELLDGESLGERLSREKRLPPPDVALVVSQTAQVLEEAHKLGVVHRDIKPDNLFLVEAGYELFVKVLDFGIAKQTSQLEVASVTDTGAIVGTPEYMSPEQLLSPKSADWRADMWALAVLAYRALIGVPPFTGETLPSLSMAICNARYLAPSEAVEGLPDGVDAWFERALQTEPGERFGSVAEMSRSLSSLLRETSSVTVRPRAVIVVDQPEGDGGTLASAMSERHPRGAPKPEIDIEEAADDPNAPPAPTESSPGFAEDGRSESSRRRGPVVIEIERARSTRRPDGERTFERAVPSTMRFDEATEKRHGRLRVVGILLAGMLALAGADFALRGPGDVPKPIMPPSAQARSDELWTDDTAIVESGPRRRADAVPKPAPAQPEQPAPAEVASAPAPAVQPPAQVAVAPVPPANPRPKAPPNKPKASAAPNPCENPYIVQADGSYKIKPGCAKR